MRMLVTGGAGCMGSITTQRLLDQGVEVHVIDNLSTGMHEKISPEAHFIHMDLLDCDRLSCIFQEHHFDVVMHFAGLTPAIGSTLPPGLYYKNNVFATVGLLNTMVNHHCYDIIFSSAVGVYGMPKDIPPPEGSLKEAALDPYRESKCAVESLLGWYCDVTPLRFVSLRYCQGLRSAKDDGAYAAHDVADVHVLVSRNIDVYASCFYNIAGDYGRME